MFAHEYFINGNLCKIPFHNTQYIRLGLNYSEIFGSQPSIYLREIVFTILGWSGITNVHNPLRLKFSSRSSDINVAENKLIIWDPDLPIK